MIAIGEEWKKLIDKITFLQSDLEPFKVYFLNRDGFKQFSENLRSEVEAYEKVYITGYFSETIREKLGAGIALLFVLYMFYKKSRES